MKNGRIVLLRHAEFQKNVPGAYYGWSDCPLTDKGLADAGALGQRLAGHGIAPGAVYSSDLSRCADTAKAAFPGADVKLVPGLREISFGEWEGMSFYQISGLPGYDEFASTGRAPGGESTDEMRARAAAAYDGILLAHAGGDVAICSHAGPIRELIAHALGFSDGAAWRFSIDMCDCAIITYADGFGWLSALNAFGSSRL